MTLNAVTKQTSNHFLLEYFKTQHLCINMAQLAQHSLRSLLGNVTAKLETP